jgi:hypothetical protein
MFTVEMLPAQRGDCLWLTYGTPPDLHHVVVDGGPLETIPTLVPELERRLKALPGTSSRVELLVISHVDADHIQGVVSLLSGPSRVRLFRDVWFNGYEHLRPGMLGAVDGERLTKVLDGARSRWNKAFRHHAVVVPDNGKLPVIPLPGGLHITLLSPTPRSLAALLPQWEQECVKAGLVVGKGAEIPRSWRRDDMLGFDVAAALARPYRADHAKPNGSSIAFVAEFDGKTVLCAADAHSEILEAALTRLGPDPHRFTAVKLSHHGSKNNTSPGFVERVRSKNWLISTNGAKFHHPRIEALARVVSTQDRPVFHLNYVTDDVQDLISSQGLDYTVKLPRRDPDGTFREGIVVRLG